MAQVPTAHKFRFPRWTDLSVRLKALVVVALPMTALLVCVILAYYIASAKTEAEDAAKNTLEVRSQLQTLYIVLISAESEIRNYGLNGHEEGLQPLGMVGPSVDALITRMSELLHDTDPQKDRLARLKQLVHERLEGLKELRAYYGSADGRRTAPPAQLFQRARISPDVLLALSEVGTKQTKLQQERAKKDEARQARLRLAMVGTAAVGLLSGILAALWFAKGIVRRLHNLKESALHLADGLRSAPALGGKDELGGLAEALETAGQSVAAQSEELRLALEGAEVLIWDLEPATGRIRYQAGSGALQNSGIPAELLPESVDKLLVVVHVEDRDRVQNELHRIATEHCAFQIEYRVVIRGGEIRWMSVKAQPHAASGQTTEHLFGVLSDITAQKIAAQKIERQAQELVISREALEQQTRILQSILDSMGDGVVVADTNGKFLVFNPAARHILGSDAFSGSAAEWSQHYGLFLPDMITLYPVDQLPILRAIRGESVDEVEIYVRPAGAAEATWVSFTARPLRENSGTVRGGVVVFRDVTASKRVAEALKVAKKQAEDANHAKSEFLSRMSHELRTPLNSILGFAQLLELDALNDQQSDNVHQILKGGYHLLDLINEILDLARIESGRISLSPEPVRMRDALKDAVDLVRPLAIQQNVGLNADAAIRCDRHVRADRQRLKQVLLNLLSNAIKFNRNGGSVVLSCVETASKRLRVEIVDTGAGISSDGLKKLFTPFERLGAEVTDVSGTGLGLALTKRLVEAMGGTIGVDSAVGLGSRFFVEFALLDDPTLWLETEDAADALIGGHTKPQRGTVLYIEDNTSNLSLVEQILAHCQGVSLLSAMQGQMGLDLAELHSPDWILLDVHLPDIPGDEVLRRLRLNPRTRDIPVTVLSADATAGQITRLMEAGAREYLTKPLDVRKLLSLLEKTMPKGDDTVPTLLNGYAKRDHTN